MVRITTFSDVTSHDYERHLAEISEIQQCFSVAGEETYVALILTRTPKTLETVLGRIKTIPGTMATKTSMVLSAPISRHTLPQEPQQEDVREFPAESPAESASIAR